MKKFSCVHIASGQSVGEFTEQEKEAYEKDPHLRHKYRFKEIKQAPVPKDAKKIKNKTADE